MKNYYETLQVVPNMSQQEIKEAFRFLLFRYHPDHNAGKEEWAVQRTMELVEAYHILTDPMRRAHFDVVRGVKIRDGVPKKGLSLFGKGKEKAKQAEALFKEGLEKYQADEHEQAIKTFRKVHELDAEYPNVKFNLAVSFLALERYADALGWLQDHAGKNKEDATARALYAKISGLALKKKVGV